MSLLLLEIGMKNQNGFETLKLVKDIFDKHNERTIVRDDSAEPEGQIERYKQTLLRPMICFYSNFNRERFTYFFEANEQPEFFLQKPVKLMDLIALLKLVRII